MSEKITIAQAIGRKVINADGSWGFLARYDPFENVFSGPGYDAPNHDPIERFIPADTLFEFGLELEPSPEELEMIDRLRLTKKVATLSTELVQAMTDWLNKPKAR